MKTLAAVFVALVGYSAFTCIVAGALGLYANAQRLAQATVAALWLPLWLPAMATWELLLKPAFLAAATLCSGSCKWHPDHMKLDKLAEQQAAETLRLLAYTGDDYVNQHEDPAGP